MFDLLHNKLRFIRSSMPHTNKNVWNHRQKNKIELNLPYRSLPLSLLSPENNILE
jgi:hypothetical protein